MKKNTEKAWKSLIETLVADGKYEEAGKIARMLETKKEAKKVGKSKENKPKMTKKELEVKVYTDISKDIIQELERVIALGDDEAVKWIRTWATTEPQNVITGKPYRGFNWLYLSMTGHTYLITAKQLRNWNMKMYGEDNKDKWATLKKDAKKLSITFSSPYTKKKEEEEEEEETKDAKKKRQYWSFKVYTVYDVRDVEGFPYPDEETPRNNDKEMPLPSALFRTWNKVVPIKYGYNEACYVPSLDEIHMPDKERFVSIQDFYGTQGHESIHSTGAKERLNRSIENPFGSKKYAEEELVAEVGGIKLANLFGFAPKIFTNTIAYLRSWIRALQDDVKALYWACVKADKAVELLVKNYNENKEPNEPEILMESVKELETKEPIEEPKAELVEEVGEPVELIEGSEIRFNPTDQTVTVSSKRFKSLMNHIETMQQLIDKYAEFVETVKSSLS